MQESTNHPYSKPSEARVIKTKQGIWRTYDATDGLPGRPQCLLQDKYGYLWIGTTAGLCRYDGLEFITYTTKDGLNSNFILSLCLDNQGRLWIGTGRFWYDTGAKGISCFDGKQFTNYTTANGLVSDQVRSLCFDSQERLWIGTWKGLSCFDGKRFTNYTTANGLADDKVNALCEDDIGRLWIGTINGLNCFDSSGFNLYTTDQGLARNQIASLCYDSKKRLWIVFDSTDSGVSCFDGQRFRTYTEEDGLIRNFAFKVYEGHDGRLWFGCWGGLSCFDGDRFIKSYSTPQGMWGHVVEDVIEDREGQIWLAHKFFAGLSCFDEDAIQFLTDEQAIWNSAQDKKSRIWIPGFKAIHGIYLDQTTSEVHHRELPYSESMMKSGLMGFVIDSKDRLGFGIFRDGMYLYNSTDEIWDSEGENLPEPRHFKMLDEMEESSADVLLESKDGTIWIGIGKKGTLVHFDPDNTSGKEFMGYIAVTSQVKCLFEDSLGRLWIGHDGGPSRWDGKTLVTYTKENGLPSDYIGPIIEDDLGKIWISTDQGIACFDGERFLIYGEEYGLIGANHRFAVKDIFGQLWFATYGGIYRTDGKHFQWLTEDDDLPSNNIAGLHPQLDGTMIICTSRGIIRYRQTATLPPKIMIREVVADKVYQNPDEIELTTTSANLLTILYHGLSLVTHRMRYSYILEGYDEDWHETWERQVRYENLLTGEYTFKIIAINRDLVPSETLATLKLKVIPDPRDIKIRILQSEVNNLRREIGAGYDFHEIIGLSDAIKEVQTKVAIAIESGLNMVVLITGETGTGKGLVAEAIHINSRKGKPKILYNCSRLTKELGASILFGHRKGAFTDAKEEGIGLFEAANGGTLILDEIGDMAIDVQANLLDVLQEHRFSKLGDHRYYDVDVQVIAMTNHDIKKEVDEGRFREDLYYRLNQFSIHLQPLRERPEDIPLLANHFLKLYSEKSGRKIDGFAPGLFEIFQRYSWPGNIRELEELIKAAVAFSVYDGSQVIQAYYFPPHITYSKSPVQDIETKGMGYRESLDLFKRRIIEDALRESGGNRAEAARMLKMERPNLVELIKRLKIKY